MLRHVVMFKKKADTDDATVDEIIARLEALQGQIPTLQRKQYHRCHRA